jgi:hypothetical protein
MIARSSWIKHAIRIIRLLLSEMVRIHNIFVRSLNTCSAGCDIAEGHGFNIHRNDDLGAIKALNYKRFHYVRGSNITVTGYQNKSRTKQRTSIDSNVPTIQKFKTLLQGPLQRNNLSAYSSDRYFDLATGKIIPVLMWVAPAVDGGDRSALRPGRCTFNKSTPVSIT